MIDHALDGLSWLSKLNENVREHIYQFALFGVTQQTVVDLKAIITMVVVGGISAFGGAFLTARDTAIEFRQNAKAQEEFRVEMRMFMREDTAEVRALADRVTRQEILMHALHPVASQETKGMGGMNGGGKSK